VEGTPTDLGNCLDGLVCSFVCQPVFYIMKWCSVITVPGLVVRIFYFLLIDGDRSDIPFICTVF
jgi:hypothetical protein